eukprot:CAMPEP_0201635114 /NCGR_PEP_ID=MMETSP0493-20130528/7778_1 /ASSEMBLY_ACC=CAM_ASM_000838 /TAXON_ID=420259 /ORGANISM="Thalassiosira gravida, Strain GMp14c1" /LENGTH=344 /DNA_ID=CAMNT_0048107043 /DNA_START=178 /DNA_END=1212 /DNA_ORIENTATION=+
MSVFWTTLLFSTTPLFDLSFHSTDALAFSPPQLQLPNFFKPATELKSTTFSYTHLEGNGQLWQATTKRNTQASIVIDPIASQLDFGIPNLYRANKNILSERQTIDLICDANPSHCLLTMGLDDHTHLPTLEQLQARMPELQYVIAPSCEQKLLEFGLNSDFITVLDHGEVCTLAEGATATATEGALVGPPWQKRENGYILELNHSNRNNNISEDGLSIYYEPHADVILNNISKLRADIMISPVTKQSLPAQVPSVGQYTLVYGGETTLQIAEILGARVLVPLGNGALDVDGPLAGLVAAEGDASDFERLVEGRNVGRPEGDDYYMRVAIATPGVPLTVDCIGLI